MAIAAEPVQVRVTLRGNVASEAGEYARGKVAKTLSVSHRPVLAAHIVLNWLPNPAVASHALAEVSADINGRVVRAKTSAPTMPEAVDDLQDRLRRQLVQLQDRDRTRHRWTGHTSAHEWRHGDLPHRQAPYVPRPEDTREVVRHKSFASTPMTVDEATFEMDLLDHDFFLYRDAGSGWPALVHRLSGGGYGVQGVDPDATVATVTYEPPPPSLTDAQARTRLEADGEPFVFYLDSSTGHARVLYHRYNGNYGLIELNS